MSELSKKALGFLQASAEKPEYFISDLTSYGFSEATAKIAIDELENAGYIFISRSYISGNVVFELL